MQQFTSFGVLHPCGYSNYQRLDERPKCRFLLESNGCNTPKDIRHCYRSEDMPEDGVLLPRRQNSTFLKHGLFLSSGEGREAPTLLGPLERATPITGLVYL
jgi:hypothetical protein